MSDYAIGISGLNAASRALEVIGNNIANAATEGYHRQRLELEPSVSVREGSLLFGRGVDLKSVRRMIDSLLDQEILRQRSSLEQVDRELVMLETLESTLGELSTEDGGLNAAIDRFFNSLADLSAHPSDIVWQNQALSDGESMVSRFRVLGEFLGNLEVQIELELDNAVSSVNALATQIAELNGKIQGVEIGGTNANNMRDQRDKLIADLADIVSVQTQERPYGVVDVTVGGIPVVMGATVMQLEDGRVGSTQIGLSVEGAVDYRTDITGGTIGGLLALRNALVSDVHDDLDTLANAIIQQVNQQHVQGVGSEGAFTELIGWRMASENLADFTSPVTDGTMYIRVTNTSTGAITRNAVTIDASTDTLTSIAADISAITGLSASVASSKLRISADSNYTFDFLPAVLSTPTASTLTGSPPTVSVSGIYSGTANDTYTFEVSGTGSVGNGTLQLVVTDSGGSTLTTVNVGSGYAAGDTLEVANGVKIALSTGSLNDGETFEVDVLANSDTSGVLAAVGMNTLLSGSGTGNIAICSEISSTPGRIAVSLGAEMADNTNALRMAGVKSETVSSLTDLTCGEFYRRLAADVGEKVSTRDMRRENIEQMVQDLGNRQSDISGVDINEEAAALLVFEQMFQAMAKYIATVRTSLSSLMSIF